MKFTFVSLSFRLAFSALLAATAQACQSTSTGDDGVTDSNTNWLMQCDSDAVCGELSCLCGVCTRRCEADLQCADLAAEASCGAWAGDDCEGLFVCVDQASMGDDPGPAAPGSNPTSGQPASPPGSTSTLDAAAVPSSSTAPTSSESPSGDPPDGGATCAAAPPECSSECNTEVSAECRGGAWVCIGAEACPPSDAGAKTPADAGDAADAATEVDAGPTDVCDTAQEGAACETNGLVCGGPCVDTCSFCNLMGCSNGVWRRLEAFPAPCYSCGDVLSCDPTLAYCQVTAGDYSCESFPTACDADRTCACLEAEMPQSTCAGESTGELVVETSGG